MVKRILVFTVLFALTLNCAYTPRHYLNYQRTQPIIISRRVGETVDVVEREQFDLFKGIEDFEFASFYKILNGGYEMIMITKQSKYIVVNRDSLAIEILGDYISRYEEIKNSKTEFEKKWKIVDYDELGQPITKYEINRVKKSNYTIGCTAATLIPGFTLAAIIELVLGIGSSFSGTEASRKPFYYVIGVTTITAVVAALHGNHQDRITAISAIKKVRQPRVVDNF